MQSIKIWGGIWLFYVFFFGYNSDNTSYILLFSAILLPITALNTKAFSEVFLPKYLQRGRYLQFGMHILLAVAITLFLVIFTLIGLVGFIPEFSMEDLPPMSKNYVFITVLVYLVVAIHSYAHLWRHNAHANMERSQLQQQLLQADFYAKEQELNNLKNQIHPHFLFNALNTIYGLSLRKSEQTPNVILKFSALLDYILYNTQKPQVPLSDEVAHIEHYIALEKIRFDDTLLLSFDNKLKEESILVAPMLLLPFVENAFKHGAAVDGFLKIAIALEIQESRLHFQIKNSYLAKPAAEGGGIGLQNIRERLEILYPGAHQLYISQHHNYFEVDLWLGAS